MRLTFAKFAAPCCGALLLLTACEEETAQAPRESEQGGKAAGEVLGGTISDDMLPLERLRSQSPPLEAAPGESDEASSEDDGEADVEGGADEGNDTPAPAPVPRPSPSPSPSPTSTGLPVAPPVDD